MRNFPCCGPLVANIIVSQPRSTSGEGRRRGAWDHCGDVVESRGRRVEDEAKAPADVIDIVESAR